MKKAPIAFVLFFVALNLNAAVILSDAFDYSDGSLAVVSSGKWANHSGTSNDLQVVSGRAQLSSSGTEDLNATLSGQPYSGGTNVLYSSFTVRFTSLPSGGGSYFAHFKDGASTFRGRIWALTNSAAPGSFRLGISSTSATISGTNTTDLSLNTEYRVVTRINLANSAATLWIDPSSEASSSVSSSDASASATVTSYALRQNSGIGAMQIDNVYVGTTFADVTPVLTPTIWTQPQNATMSAGKNATLFVVATGSGTLSYQWDLNGTNIANATSSTLTLTNISSADAGSYRVTVNNSGGSIVSDTATLTVTPIGATVSFLTYNVKGNGVTDWSTNSSQVQAVGRQVSYLQPDIITFNEIPYTNTYQMTNFVKQFLPGYYLATNSGTDLFIRSVICSRFPITRSQSWLDSVSLVPFGYTGNFSRDLFEAQISVPTFTEPLHVFVTHLKAQADADSSAKRAAEASCVSNFFVNTFLTTNSTHPYLLAGDMNEDINRPPGASQQPIQRLTNSTGLFLTTPRNPVNNDDRTISIQSGMSDRFDYILPGPLLFYNIASSQIFRTDLLEPTPPGLQQLDDKTASDHLPVLMVFNNPYTASGTAPAFTTEPTTRTNVAGTTAQFSTSVTGTQPLTYRWLKNGLLLNNGGNVLGATSPTLTVSGVVEADGADYSVVVTNLFGSVTSSNATLVIVRPPTITAQPVNQSSVTDSNAQFTVSVSGTAPFSYQWLKNGSPLSNDGNISGADTATLTVSNLLVADAGTYSVVITNLYGSAISSNATLTVLVPPTITVQPLSRTNVVGTAAAFSFKASGTPPLYYQWKRNGVDLPEGPRVFGANYTNFAIIDLTLADAGTYTVEVTNSVGSTTTQPAILTVWAPPAVTTQPQSQSVVLGTDVTFGVNFTGTLPMGFQWYFNGHPLSGATQSSYTVPNAQNTHAGTYCVVLSNSVTSVVSSNATLSITWTDNPFVYAAGMYNGLFYEDNAVTHESAGFLMTKILTNRAFSGKLLLNGDTLSFSGRFAPDGKTNIIVPRLLKKGKPDLTVNLSVEFGNQIVRGSVGASNWVSTILADRAVFNTTNLATNFSGKYTMLFPGSTNPTALPPGYGYGLITVFTNGKVTFAGGMADGIIPKQAVAVSARGDWPLYAPLYPGISRVTNNAIITTNKDFKGSLIGWVKFTNSPTREMAGTLSWIKSGWTNAVYHDGFTNQFDLMGSLYVPPAKGTRALAITNGSVVLSDGNLVTPLTRNVFIQTNNAMTITPTTNTVRLALGAATGLLQGSFLHPNLTNTKPTLIKGAVLQQQNFGAGYFVGTNEGGLMMLQGN